MRVSLCDDDKPFMAYIRKLIESTYADNDKLQLDEYESGCSLLKGHLANPYDIVILDIEMVGLTGMETARKIRSVDRRVVIAFLTSHQEFAISGYEVGAFRYMLKGQPEHMYIEQFCSMFSKYHQTHQAYCVKQNGEVHSIMLEDILYFEIFKRTLVLHAVANNYRFTGRLMDIEKDGRFADFVKPHKSYLVNLAHIKSVRGDSVLLDSGEDILLSRNYKQSVVDRFVRYLSAGC